MATNILKNVKKHVVEYVRQNLFNDLLVKLNSFNSIGKQRKPEYIVWRLFDLADIVNEFVRENQLLESGFIKRLNSIFKTERFEILLNKWMVEYLVKLFDILDNAAAHQSNLNRELTLEDNPLNRYASRKYFSKFGALPKIKWNKQRGLLHKLFSVFLLCLFFIWRSLKSGIKLSGKKKQYKVMREAIYGLYNSHGFYFHDDFLVDNDKIKKEDLILFLRVTDPRSSERLEAYSDAERSQYACFELQRLSMGIKPFFTRIIPKYIFGGSISLLSCINSSCYSLFSSIWGYFALYALQYEKVFSNFKIISELGHNYSSATHIAEAIICQNYGTRYCLFHWSDTSQFSSQFSKGDYTVSFLGCDQYLVWGKAHIGGVEGNSSIVKPVGYVFKKFIKEVKSKRKDILIKMGINAKGKIISFFDESSGEGCLYTEENYITFWKTILKSSELEKTNTILIRPKDWSTCNNLSVSLKQEFINIKDKLEKMPNVYIVDISKWSFIEVIGVSDVAVTQGVTSSATIAIICGINGLYFEPTMRNHPFKKRFKDKLVFDNPEKLLQMCHDIVIGKKSPMEDIPEDMLRSYDAFDDDCGIDRFRSILTEQSQ